MMSHVLSFTIHFRNIAFLVTLYHIGNVIKKLLIIAAAFIFIFEAHFVEPTPPHTQLWLRFGRLGIFSLFVNQLCSCFVNKHSTSCFPPARVACSSVYTTERLLPTASLLLLCVQFFHLLPSLHNQLTPSLSPPSMRVYPSLCCNGCRQLRPHPRLLDSSGTWASVQGGGQTQGQGYIQR